MKFHAIQAILAIFFCVSLAKDENTCDPCQKGLSAAEVCHTELNSNLDKVDEKYATATKITAAMIDHICCSFAKAHSCILDAAQLCDDTIDGQKEKKLIVGSAEDYLKKQIEGICFSYKYHGQAMPLKCKLVFQEPKKDPITDQRSNRKKTIGWIIGGVIMALLIAFAIFVSFIKYQKWRRRTSNNASNARNRSSQDQLTTNSSIESAL